LVQDEAGLTLRTAVQIIPVIDIRNGIAVRAVAGERSRYRPLKGRLTDTAEPAEVLTALRRVFGFLLCYIADLDAIERQQINRCTIGEMARTGVALIVDAGATTVEQIDALLEIGVRQVVLSSESMQDLTQVETMVKQFDSASLIFSIDLKHGELLVSDPAWQGNPPLDLVRFVIERGIRQLIVLDLAAVGTGHGIPTLKLCQDIRRISPEIRIISGGGVDSAACVTDAAQAGLDGLLIASALHDGRLTANDLAEYLHL
jgi:phosphoribosylformimino-5-aminoimidazole carboxamide ribotide isomerase